MAPKKRAGGGKKSFLKGVARGESDEIDTDPAESEESQLQCTSEGASHSISDSAAQALAPTGPSAANASAAITQTQNTAGGGARASGNVEAAVEVNGIETDGHSGGGETRGQMLQRHKKEVKALKETVKKMGKKRKDESLALEASMESRHVAELRAIESRIATEAQQEILRQQAAGEAVATEEEDAVAAALAANSLYAKTAATENQESSRAQKRKQKVAAQGAEREARIAMELVEAGDSKRQLEEAALQELLLPLGFVVRDIQPDGNCMYRAVEDQLRLRDSGQGVGLSSYAELRQQAVDHMREREIDFLPFFAQEEEGEDEGDDAHERFQRYCSRMSEAAAWGSQMELRALAQCLRQRIDVHSVGLPTVLMGEEFEGEPLRVCYLRHAYGMGEHYNSIGLAAGSDQEDV